MTHIWLVVQSDYMVTAGHHSSPPEPSTVKISRQRYKVSISSYQAEVQTAASAGSKIHLENQICETVIDIVSNRMNGMSVIQMQFKTALNIFVNTVE